MEPNEPIHVSAILDEMKSAIGAVVGAIEDKGLTATRVEHAGIYVLALTNAVMQAASMATHPASLGSFLIQLGFRYLQGVQQTGTPTLQPSVSLEATLPPDLEVVNLQAQPPKPAGL